MDMEPNNQLHLPLPLENQARVARSSPFPVLSWNAPDSHLISQMRAAKDGAMLITNLNIRAPMIGARETFCKLYQEPDLVTEHINKLHEPRGLYKYNAFFDKEIDQKIILDLSPSHITQILEKKLALGNGFNEVMDFYNTLQESVVPRLLTIVSSAIAGEGVDYYGVPRSNKIAGIHYGLNHKLRLVDYFPVHSTSQRCGEHRDYSTFTLIFQDRTQGGLEVLLGSKWTPVPVESEVVLLWGWSTFIMSNGRLPAPLHRVVPIKTGEKYRKTPRRNEIVLYVSPDWNAYLVPHIILPGEAVAFNLDAIRDLTLKDFKNRFQLKWHEREGTTIYREEVLPQKQKKKEKSELLAAQTQDDEVISFLFGMGKY